MLVLIPFSGAWEIMAAANSLLVTIQHTSIPLMFRKSQLVPFSAGIARVISMKKRLQEVVYVQSDNPHRSHLSPYHPPSRSFQRELTTLICYSNKSVLSLILSLDYSLPSCVI